MNSTEPIPVAAALPLASLLDNLAAEIAVAEAICVSVEEIITSRLRAGGSEDAAVRVELQNVDRLIQMLRDFRTLLSHLGETSDGVMVDARAAGAHLVMDELRRRLLSPEPGSRRDRPSVAPSEITFF